MSPTNTIPMDAKSYSPEDTPKFLPDEAIRGSMAMLYEDIIGPADATFSFGGPAFLDTHGFFLDNIFGDLSTTGTVSAGTSTSFSGSPAVGATAITVGNGTTFTVGQTVQIDTGSRRRGGDARRDSLHRHRVREQPAPVRARRVGDRVHGRGPVHAHVRVAQQPARATGECPARSHPR